MAIALTEEAKRRYNANRRKRYATDPAYKERVQARNQEALARDRHSENEKRRKKRAENHVWREKQNEKAAKKRGEPGYAEKIRRYHREWRYGLSHEKYTEMVEAQNGSCAICKAITDLLVDHDHNTGAVRGLLCRPCNSGIGQFYDSPARLLSAIEYLARFK